MKWHPIPIKGFEHYEVNRSGEVLNTRYRRKIKPILVRGRYSKFTLFGRKRNQRIIWEVQCNTLMDLVFGVKGARDGHCIKYVDKNPMNPRLPNLMRGKNQITWSLEPNPVVGYPVRGGHPVCFESIYSAGKHLGVPGAGCNILSALDTPCVRYGYRWRRA